MVEGDVLLGQAKRRAGDSIPTEESLVDPHDGPAHGDGALHPLLGFEEPLLSLSQSVLALRLAMQDDFLADAHYLELGSRLRHCVLRPEPPGVGDTLLLGGATHLLKALLGAEPFQHRGVRSCLHLFLIFRLLPGGLALQRVHAYLQGIKMLGESTFYFFYFKTGCICYFAVAADWGACFCWVELAISEVDDNLLEVLVYCVLVYCFFLGANF